MTEGLNTPDRRKRLNPANLALFQGLRLVSQTMQDVVESQRHMVMGTRVQDIITHVPLVHPEYGQLSLDMRFTDGQPAAVSLGLSMESDGIAVNETWTYWNYLDRDPDHGNVRRSKFGAAEYRVFNRYSHPKITYANSTSVDFHGQSSCFRHSVSTGMEAVYVEGFAGTPGTQSLQQQPIGPVQVLRFAPADPKTWHHLRTPPRVIEIKRSNFPNFRLAVSNFGPDYFGMGIDLGGELNVSITTDGSRFVFPFPPGNVETSYFHDLFSRGTQIFREAKMSGK